MNRSHLFTGRWMVASVASLALATAALADRPKPASKPPAAPAGGAPAAAEPGEDDGAEAGQAPGAKNPFADIKFEPGPLDGSLEDLAAVKVPSGFLFAGGKVEAEKFMVATNNPPSHQEVGVLLPTEGKYFVVFEFNPIGYVKDDEKDKLNADEILKSIQEGTEASNADRRARGWPEFHVEGWHTQPRYNPATHNLEWATIGRSSTGSRSVNYEIRLLGRRGVMACTLVIGPDIIDSVMPKMQELVSGFAYKQEESYAAYKPGDKVAEYGLVALAGGGVLAVAAKSGLLGKIWKLIVAAIVALGAGIKRLFGGKKGEQA